MTPPDACRCTVLSPYIDQRGGAELSLIHALKSGRENGVDFSLAVPREGEIGELAKSLGIPVCVFGASRTRNPVGFARSVLKIRSFSRGQRSELILSWDAQLHFRGAAVSIVAGVPAAWFRKGGVDSSRTSRLLARLPARAILANSVYTADRQANQQAAAGNPLPIHVAPSAVDLQEFDPERLPSPAVCRQRLGLPTKGRCIVMVGRLQRWKGFHTLIEALALLTESRSQTHLVLVGGEHPTEPGYRAELERLAARLGVADTVHLIGFAVHDEISSYMQAADIVVHASVGEPFGIVVIEAMALAKPIVAAAEGGPTTVITDGRDGLLADPCDPAAISRQLERLLGDPALAARLGGKARERARVFSLEHFGRRLAATIRSIISDESPAGVIVEDGLRPPAQVLTKGP